MTLWSMYMPLRYAFLFTLAFTVIIYGGGSSAVRITEPITRESSGQFNTIPVTLDAPFKYSAKLTVRLKVTATAGEKPLYTAFNFATDEKKKGFLMADGSAEMLTVASESRMSKASVVSDSPVKTPWTDTDTITSFSVYMKFPKATASRVTIESLEITADESAAPVRDAGRKDKKYSDAVLHDLAVADERAPVFQKAVPGDHPRVLILKKELPAFRSFFKKTAADPAYAYLLKDALAEPADAPLVPEPPRLPKKRDSTWAKMWQDAFQSAFKAASTAQRFAFAYLITGEERYGREAARWLTHVASWDVNGGVEIRQNDEAFIQSLSPMIAAYDWCYDALTPKERTDVEAALQTRMDILFATINRKFSAVDPTPLTKAESHAMRFISTLGLGGLALYRTQPDAADWLGWAYEYYVRQFPVWGGTDGGYSEGINYWASGHNQHFKFLDAMRAIKMEDFKKPYFSNNGYYAVYNILPFTHTSFGDLNQYCSATSHVAMHAEKYALMNSDPYLMKYNEVIFNRYPDGVNYYVYSFFDSLLQKFRTGASLVPSRELSELPRSRVFNDIGMVAMHSSLGSVSDDIMLGFRSSPYGSYSHSFADQNAFVVNAFGESLAMSTGYREWYGSPHHFGYSKSTFSQNAILFGGKGQMVQNANAKGSIVRFYTGKDYDFTTGDASAAYAKESAVTTALRSILFVRKKYFIVFDELASQKPGTHQWLLHAKDKMTDRPDAGEVVIQGRQAKLTARIIAPCPCELSFSQTDQFTVPVDAAYAAKLKSQWHYTIAANDEKEQREFVTLLHPQQNASASPAVSENRQASKGYAAAVRDTDTEDIILLAKHGEGEVTSSAGTLRGVAGSASLRGGSPQGFVLIDGTSLIIGDVTVSASRPVSMEGMFETGRIALSVKTAEPVDITVRMPFAPKQADGAPGWRYNEKASSVRFTASGTMNAVFWKDASSIALTLDGITVGGSKLASFIPTTYGYIIRTADNKPPAVEARITARDAAMSITQASALPGKAVITLSNAAQTVNYEIHFIAGAGVTAPAAPPKITPETTVNGIRVVASSDDGNVAANTLDGKPNTRWSAEGAGQWIHYDLGTAKTITGLTIAFYRGDSRATLFDIESSDDGKQWKKIYSGKSGGKTAAAERFTFTPVNTRFIRIYGRGNTENGWNSIAEVSWE